MNQRREVFKWLSNPSTNQDLFQDSLKKRVEGTCEWILECPAFLQWHSPSLTKTNPRILWIHGPGGFGKTILCASLVKHLSSDISINVATYFFSSNFDSREDPSLAARSWVAQVVEQDPAAFDTVRDKLEDDVDTTASRSTIYNLLSLILRNTKPCLLVLDGLDECASFEDNEAQSATSFLRHIIQTISGINARLLVVSRGLQAIRQVLDTSKEGYVEHSITVEDVKFDNAAVSNEIVGRKLKKKDTKSRALISEILLQKCQGQFLWVRLQESKLRGSIPVKMLQNSLENTPADLYKIYDRDWVRIDNLEEDLRDWAISLLRWTACAARPLTVAETTGAIMIDRPREELEAYADSIDEDYVNEMFKDLCGSLIDVHHDTILNTAARITLRIPHFTIRQFLLSRLPFPHPTIQYNRLHLNNEQRQHALLTELCLRYLNNPLIWEATSPGSPLTWIRGYASELWQTHARRGWRGDLTELVVKLILGKSTLGWRKYIEEVCAPKAFIEAPTWAPLAHAVRLDLPHVLLSLIQQKGCQIDQFTADQILTTPLGYACQLGKISLVQILLDNGAQISLGSGSRNSQAIHWASGWGRASIVRLLVSRGASANAKRSDEYTPLMGAAYYGHDEVVYWLLYYGADPSSRSADGVTPLASAAAQGHAGVVKQLLRAGAACNVIALSGAPALNHACARGRLDVVNLLIDHPGVQLDITTDAGDTPLHAASMRNHVDIVQRLLEAGADIHRCDRKGYTALNFAVNNGNADLVRILLQNKAAHDTTEHDGWQPLAFACESGHLDVVQLLLEHGADPNYVKVIENKRSNSALALAARNGFVKIVQCLLDRGAVVGTYNSQVDSPMHNAAREGHYDIVKLLAERDVTSVSVKNLYGRSSMWIAAVHGHHRVVQVLLQYDAASVRDEDECHRSPLRLAAEHGSHEILSLLLAHPQIRPDHVDVWGQTALYWAALRGHSRCVSLLLGEGRCDPEISDRNLSSPLAVAALAGHLEVVKLLLADDRVDPAHRDAKGDTALLLAASKGHVQIVQDLLDDGRVNPNTLSDSGWTPLVVAALHGYHEVVALLLAHPHILVCSEESCPNGRTAFYVATMRGHDLTMRMLLNDGRSKVNLLYNNEWTPLMAAAKNGHLETVKLLLTVPDLDTSYASFEGLTAISLAASVGRSDIVQALLDDGRSDAGVHPQSGWSPLLVSAANGHTETVQLLLRSPMVDPMLTGVDGMSALSQAALDGHARIVQILLADGRSDIHTRDRWGQTPLMLAAEEGHHEVVREFLALAQMDLGCRDSDGSTALDLAASNGHTEVTRMLLDDGRANANFNDP